VAEFRVAPQPLTPLYLVQVSPGQIVINALDIKLYVVSGLNLARVVPGLRAALGLRLVGTSLCEEGALAHNHM
jgi:hypothetical protein